MVRRSSSVRGLRFRIGIHSGIVGLPNLPAAGAGVPAMQGNVPNLALRLCEHAGANRVVMSQATFDLTSGLFHSERQADSSALGGPRASPVYEVLRELESGSRFEQAFAARTTPFVGRDAELRVLNQLWQEAKDGRGQVLVVSGDAGIGKSRLVQQLKEQVIEEQNVRLTCQCRPHYKNSALHPVIELVLRSMGIRRDDPPERKLEKAEQSLNEFGFSLPENLPLFASFLSIPLDARGPSDGSEPAHVVYTPLALSPEQQKVKTLEGLVSMLLRMALTRPTLFIVEDMHWVDHSTVEFLNALVDLVPGLALARGLDLPARVPRALVDAPPPSSPEARPTVVGLHRLDDHARVEGPRAARRDDPAIGGDHRRRAAVRRRAHAHGTRLVAAGRR